MSKEQVKATARVRLVIDVPVSDTWGSDCPVSQIHRQARESALALLGRAVLPSVGLPRPELGALIDSGRARVIEAEVTTVLVSEDR